MNVAQRGTSSTSEGYYTVDRFYVGRGGTDEAPEQAQTDLSSSGHDATVYNLGFRKSLRVQNGNQSGGAGAGDYIVIQHTIEAQDIANSGWNYTSTSSFITLSFYVLSTVAQNYYGYLQSKDGTQQSYPFETGTLTANTWTKVVLKIPGNSNLQFDNNANAGLELTLWQFAGTNYTDSGVSLNAWGAYNSSQRMPDNTSTFYTTNNAQFELVGLQLEVGSQATTFEHRSFGEELSLCQRYFYMHANGEFDLSNTDRCPIGLGYGYTTTSGFVFITFPTRMRSNPSLYKVVGTDYFNFAYNNNNSFPNDISANRMSNQVCELSFHTASSWDQNAAGMFRTYNTAARVGFDAEL